jgi:hypothetical protein
MIDLDAILRKACVDAALTVMADYEQAFGGQSHTCTLASIRREILFKYGPVDEASLSFILDQEGFKLYYAHEQVCVKL